MNTSDRYETLLTVLSYEPQVYESTGLAFWDDEHISKTMLKNHLSPDTAGATREHDSVSASVSWLASLQKPEGKLLDLGCGPGLYADAQGNNPATGGETLCAVARKG